MYDSDDDRKIWLFKLFHLILTFCLPICPESTSSEDLSRSSISSYCIRATKRGVPHRAYDLCRLRVLLAWYGRTARSLRWIF